MTPTRQEAFSLLTRYTHSESLIKHALSVEGVMRHFASLYGEDVEKWGVIGLIHDLDYEQYPEQHCHMTYKILCEEQYPEDYIRAVMSHGWGICTDTEPEPLMENVLYTIDELTGLITAAVLVRPSKSIFDLEVRSVKKKWNQKGFAAGANREVIEQGAMRMGKDLDYVIGETIAGMKAVAATIGLAGE
ncbi:MAG: HDIG domain-containing metalloprotein [Bacteroidota bacterium]